MKIENKFQKWVSSFSGCDGGDIGSPESRSTWVCGIEWGGGHDPVSLKENIVESVDSPPYGYENHSENLAYIFNRQTMKLLTAIQGDSVENYIQVSEKIRPFVKDEKGFFKMNLFPVAFKDTNHQRWLSDFIDITGFQSKHEYLTWCRKVRFPIIQSWVEKFKPKLIICFGKTFSIDFESAFINGNSEFKKETILNRELSWSRTQDKTLIVICPFPVNRYGLNSHVLLQAFGERIQTLMNDN